MGRIRRVISKLITHTINFLIDAKDIISKEEYVLLSETEMFKDTQYCPWCSGIGLLTKEGENIEGYGDE